MRTQSTVFGSVWDWAISIWKFRIRLHPSNCAQHGFSLTLNATLGLTVSSDSPSLEGMAFRSTKQCPSTPLANDLWELIEWKGIWVGQDSKKILFPTLQAILDILYLAPGAPSPCGSPSSSSSSCKEAGHRTAPHGQTDRCDGDLGHAMCQMDSLESKCWDWARRAMVYLGSQWKNVTNYISKQRMLQPSSHHITAGQWWAQRRVKMRNNRMLDPDGWVAYQRMTSMSQGSCIFPYLEKC